jgi:hypothetical protein
VRLNTANVNETVEHVKQAWTKAFPGNPFEYFFLDDYFNKQYENERKFSKVFTTFAALAVIVAWTISLYSHTAHERDWHSKSTRLNGERNFCFALAGIFKTDWAFHPSCYSACVVGYERVGADVPVSHPDFICRVYCSGCCRFVSSVHRQFFKP